MEAFWGHLGAFGWPLAVFLLLCVGKRETAKSVVLLKENLCFEGWRGCLWEPFFIFFGVWRCWEAGWELEAIILEAERAGSWKI